MSEIMISKARPSPAKSRIDALRTLGTAPREFWDGRRLKRVNRGYVASRTRIIVGLVAACAVIARPFACQAKAQPREVQNSSIRVPDFGTDTRIIGVFEKPNKDLVIEFSFTKDGSLRVGFYDPRENRRLSEDKEAEAATDNAVLSATIGKFSLTRLYGAGTLRLNDGREVSSTSFTGRLCEGWPFENFMQISPPRGSSEAAIRKTVVLKRPGVEKKAYYCSAIQVRPSPISYSYVSEPLTFFRDEGGGFYAEVFHSPYLIHFDGRGNYASLLNPNEMRLVDTVELEEIFETFKSGAIPASEAIRRSVATIERRNNSYHGAKR